MKLLIPIPPKLTVCWIYLKPFDTLELIKKNHHTQSQNKDGGSAINNNFDILMVMILFNNINYISLYSQPVFLLSICAFINNKIHIIHFKQCVICFFICYPPPSALFRGI